MPSTVPHVSIIEIAHLPGDRVSVRMPDNDRMVSNSTAAAIACRAFADQIAFKSQLDRLLDDLGEFLIAQEDKVRDAYITPQDSGLLFVVVQREKAYDRELDDQLANLEWEIARDKSYSLIRLQTQLLPPASQESLNSFLSAEGTMQFRRMDVEG